MKQRSISLLYLQIMMRYCDTTYEKVIHHCLPPIYSNDFWKTHW